MRRPGALTSARLLPAVPVGAGGWGGGRAVVRLLSRAGEGGTIPPASGGGGRRPRGLRACWGAGGGGSRRGLPAPPLGGGPRFPTLAPLLSSAHSPPACAFGRGRGAALGGGGMGGRPWTAPPGAPSDLNPPSALHEWAMVMEGVMGGAAPILFWCAAVRRPQAWSARRSGVLLWVRSRRLGALGRAVCRSSRIPPPPGVAVPSGVGGASPLAPGGRKVAPEALKLGGGIGGGGGGAAPPPPGPPPRGALACHPLSPARPPGVYSCRRGCRAAAGVGRDPVGRQWVSAARGEGGGGNPPTLARAPAFPRPASEGAAPFAPSWAPPVRRRSAAGRAGACRRLLGALAAAAVPPHPGCSGLFGGGAAPPSLRSASVALGPEGEGRGSGGPPLVPWRRPLTAEGARPGGPGPGGQPSAGGSHSSPALLYLEPDPRAGPRWGPLSHPPLPRGAGRPGAAVRVRSQRLAGCGAVGSPPRSLPPPSLPREVVRAPPSRRIVGGVWVRAPSSPPHSLASAVWAVTCDAACVQTGAVAVAGCAGGSASG